MNSFQLATITGGKYKGKNVSIVAQYGDDKAVVEFSPDEEKQFDSVELAFLRLWKTVESTGQSKCE